MEKVCYFRAVYMEDNFVKPLGVNGTLVFRAVKRRSLYIPRCVYEQLD